MTEANGAIPLMLPGGNSSSAQALSADGGTVIGSSSVLVNGSQQQCAFVWTASGGVQDLTLPGGTYSSAVAVSADGRTVTGSSHVLVNGSQEQHAFVWTEAGGLQDLGTLPGGNNSLAQAVSDDGGTVVGTSSTLVNGSQQQHAFVWTAAGGLQDLGILPGGARSSAQAVSADVSVTYATPHAGQPCQVTFNWDDGTTTDLSANSGVATAARHYAAAGVYRVSVTVTDADGAQGTDTFEYVVIYDPNGGFVTGGGWIQSPAGAYVADPSLTGKANFGFVSRYLKGATVPTGNTEFQFKAGHLDFSSTVYHWLVVSGAKAQYKGSGTINGSGEYGFLLTAVDGQVTGGGGVDKFRIKIWNKSTGAVVYDNRPGVSDDLDGADPQAIGGGSIVIHKAR